MSAQLPTIWEASNHTLAKHQILETYLKAWVAIMSSQARRLGMPDTRLLFVDGFAGPGIYARGEQGSPVLAIKLVLDHSHDLHAPVSFLFIELDPERCAKLKDSLRQFNAQSDESSRIKSVIVEQGDCETILNKYFEKFDNQSVALHLEDLLPAL